MVKVNYVQETVPSPVSFLWGQHSPLSPLLHLDFCHSIMYLLSWNYYDLFLSLSTNLFKIFCHHFFSLWVYLDSYHHWWHFQHSSWFFRCKTKYKKDHFHLYLFSKRRIWSYEHALTTENYTMGNYLFSKKGLINTWTIIIYSLKSDFCKVNRQKYIDSHQTFLG